MKQNNHHSESSRTRKIRQVLVILDRLQHLERMAEAAEDGLLSPGETKLVRRAVARLRKLVSPSVMACYAALKRAEPELADQPELFALAVVLAAYGRSSAARRCRRNSVAVRPHNRAHPGRNRMRITRRQL
jgi:hypothetical protein